VLSNDKLFSLSILFLMVRSIDEDQIVLLIYWSEHVLYETDACGSSYRLTDADGSFASASLYR